MGYGRKEIEGFLDQWIERSKSLIDPFAVPSERLFNLVCSNLGWNWDVNGRWLRSLQAYGGAVCHSGLLSVPRRGHEAPPPHGLTIIAQLLG